MSRCILLVTLFIYASLANAQSSLIRNDSAIGLTMGDTYAEQNINTLNSSEIFYYKKISFLQRILPDAVIPMYELNTGLLKSSGTQGWLVGVGPKLGLNFTSNLYLTAAFRFVYLDTYKFRTDDNKHMRHYGGHRQFQYYWDLNYAISPAITLGYRWLHMSNGMQVLPESLKYDHNPVIETHNLVLTFDFD